MLGFSLHFSSSDDVIFIAEAERAGELKEKEVELITVRREKAHCWGAARRQLAARGSQNSRL